jgi:hypothetical protein
MTHATRRIITVLSTLALASCAGGCGPRPQVKAATLKDLGAFKTYAWYPGEGDVVGVYGNRGTLAREVMHDSVDKAMQRKGFRPAPEGAADLLVLYRLGVRSRREVTGVRTVERNGEAFAVPDEVTIYRNGTVLIYLFDPKAGDVAWVGTAQAEAKAADSDAEARKRLERGVRAAFDAMKKTKTTPAAGATSEAP